MKYRATKEYRGSGASAVEVDAPRVDSDSLGDRAVEELEGSNPTLAAEFLINRAVSAEYFREDDLVKAEEIISTIPDNDELLAKLAVAWANDNFSERAERALETLREQFPTRRKLIKDTREKIERRRSIVQGILARQEGPGELSDDW